MNLGRWRAATLAAAMLAGSANAFSASNYQDWWWDPAQSGMGFNVGHQGDTVVVAWYHYDDGGRATYMLLSGKLVGGVLQGNLERTAGPAPGPSYSSQAVQRSVPGTARIAFTSDNSATFTYNYDGKTGTIPLQRYSYATPSIAGGWHYAGVFTRSGCMFAGNNGSGDESGEAWISANGGNGYTMSMADDAGGSCTYTLNLPQAGSIFAGTGTFSCTGGITGTVTISKLRMIDGFLTAEYQSRITTGESCNITGKIGAVR